MAVCGNARHKEELMFRIKSIKWVTKKRGRTSENHRVTESLGDNITTVTSKRARHSARLHHGGCTISKHAVTCCCEYFNMITINGSPSPRVLVGISCGGSRFVFNSNLTEFPSGWCDRRTTGVRETNK